MTGTLPGSARPGGGVAPVVLDASAVVALLLDPGPRGARIADLLAAAPAHAPALLPFEVANVLRRLQLARIVSATAAALAHDDLLRLPVELWPYEVVADRAVALAGSLTAFDAAYVALADLLGGTLVTADRRLAAAPGVRCPVAEV